MLNFEKSISSTKEYFSKPKDGIKMSFMIDLVKKEQIWISKTILASISRDFVDSYVKTNIFMSIYIDNFAQNSQTHIFLSKWCNIYILVRASSVKDFTFDTLKSATSF